MTTFELFPLTDCGPMESPSMSSAAGSPARTSARRGTARGSLESDRAFGSNTLESFASYDPASSSWKTSQRSWVEGLDACSETWPKRGTMRSGIASAPVTLAPRTGESGCSLWPTPRASEIVGRQFTERALVQNRNKCNLEEDILQACGSLAIGMGVNPAWVESLMGFPPGWTDGLPVPEKTRKNGKLRESATPAKERRAVSAKPASKPSATRSSRKSVAKLGAG